MATAALPALDNGDVLLAWLNLIGWRTEIRCDGDHFLGVATHRSMDATLRVHARERTHAELAGGLFEAAMRLLEPHGSGLRRHTSDSSAGRSAA